MSSILSLGMNSLLAYQYALTITSQNLANASTPYYSRRIVEFSENPFNQGVSVGDVDRISDAVTNQYDQQSTSNLSGIGSYLADLKNFEPLFDKTDISIGKSITASLSALEKLNTGAASMTDRGLYLGQLGDLVNRFQSINSQINQAKQSNGQQINVDVQQVNALLQGLASVNDQLGQANNQSNLSLMDQRDGLIQNIAKYMNFTTQIDSNGVASLSLSNGMLILSGNQAKTITTVPDSSNPQNLLIAVNDNGVVSPIMDYIQSGELVGLTQFQKNVLEPTQRAVSRLAMGIAQSFNQQNKLGMDLNGNLGANIFADINSSSAISNRVAANMNNTGTSNMSVSITDIAQLTTSDYQLSIGPSQSYVLTRLSDHAVMSSGTLSTTFPQSITADGFSISVNSGTFNAGDQYRVSPTAGGANNFTLNTQDPSKLALGWPVMATVGNQAPGSTGAIQVTGITDTTNNAFSTPKNLNPPVQIKFLTATSYQIINANNGQVIDGPLTYDAATGANIFPSSGSGYDPGYRVALSGFIQAGDTFDIGYNTNAADNKNGLAMAQLYQQGILDQGTLSWGQGYEQLSSAVSMETSLAKSNYDTADIIKQQSDARRDAISGVSLEEETMSLNQYEQYYQASAQILTTAKVVFDTIIQMTR